MKEIADRIRSLRDYFREKPEKALSMDTSATARLESGLLCRIEGPDGTQIETDMPKGIGGEATAPSPGWFLRAATASCCATLIAMRAAEEGIRLDDLEVIVDSESDNRGLLGMGDASPAAVWNRLRIRIGAEGVEPERLERLVRWADAHSPVGETIRRQARVTTEVEII